MTSESRVKVRGHVPSQIGTRSPDRSAHLGNPGNRDLARQGAIWKAAIHAPPYTTLDSGPQHITRVNTAACDDDISVEAKTNLVQQTRVRWQLPMLHSP